MALFAADNWNFCAIPTVKPLSQTHNQEHPVNIQSDLLDIINKDLMSFRGNVLLEQEPDLKIQSNKLTYNKNSTHILVDTPSLFSTRSSKIQSDSFAFNNEDNTGNFKTVDAAFLENHRFISAEELLQINEFEQRFLNFSYSSCEPGDNSWSLKSTRLDLNDTTGMGIAKNVTIRLLDVPIFYFPYFQFPIDNNRHTGLLMPSIDLSNTRGNVLAIPLYLNLHPQLDSVVSFNFYSENGLQINTETRYLTQTSSGRLITSSINDDETELYRFSNQLTHQTTFADNFNLTIVAQNMSDREYFSDLGRQGSSKDPDYLTSSLTLSHSLQTWTSSLLFEQHQILNEAKSIADRPYARKPSLTTHKPFLLMNELIKLDLNASFIEFEKDDSVTGSRLIFNPVLSHESSNAYSFIRPRLSLFSKHYDLQLTDDSRDEINLNAGIFSLDSGLFFERIASEENAWLQTFEPRLYYVHSPFVDQSSIPDFDSGSLSASYSNLFVDNRFNGGDRVGDSRHLSLGLSSKLLSLNSGLELFRVSLGKTYFAEDRQVQISGTSITDDKTSDLFVELASQPTKQLRFSANATQDSETSFLNQKTISASYSQNKNIFNLSYRFKGTETAIEIEQTDISAVYPVTSQWNLFANRKFSLKDDEIVEQLLGIRYDSCCWTFSAIAFDNSTDDFSETDRTLFFQLNLKGLTNIGRRNQEFLKARIPGYNPNF